MNPKRANDIIDVAAAVIINNGKILLVRRKPKKVLEGYWELPGGVILEGETPEEALKRKLKRSFGVEAVVGDHITLNVFKYPSQSINLFAYFVTTDKEIDESEDHDRFEWVKPENQDQFKVTPADVPIIQLLCKLM